MIWKMHKNYNFCLYNTFTFSYNWSASVKRSLKLHSHLIHATPPPTHIGLHDDPLTCTTHFTMQIADPFSIAQRIQINLPFIQSSKGIQVTYRPFGKNVGVLRSFHVSLMRDESLRLSNELARHHPLKHSHAIE